MYSIIIFIRLLGSFLLNCKYQILLIIVIDTTRLSAMIRNSWNGSRKHRRKRWAPYDCRAWHSRYPSRHLVTSSMTRRQKMTHDSLSGDAAKIFPGNYPVLDVCPPLGGKTTPTRLKKDYDWRKTPMTSKKYRKTPLWRVIQYVGKTAWRVTRWKKKCFSSWVNIISVNTGTK